MNKKKIKILFFLFGFLLSTGLASSWFVASGLISPALSTVGHLPVDLPGRNFRIDRQQGGLLVGWHIPQNKPRGIILLFHGIRSSRLSLIDLAQML